MQAYFYRRPCSGSTVEWHSPTAVKRYLQHLVEQHSPKQQKHHGPCSHKNKSLSSPPPQNTVLPSGFARTRCVPVLDEGRQSHQHLRLVLALEGKQDSHVHRLKDRRDVEGQEDDGDLRVVVLDAMALVVVRQKSHLFPSRLLDKGDEDLVKPPRAD